MYLTKLLLKKLNVQDRIRIKCAQVFSMSNSTREYIFFKYL